MAEKTVLCAVPEQSSVGEEGESCLKPSLGVKILLGKKERSVDFADEAVVGGQLHRVDILFHQSNPLFSIRCGLYSGFHRFVNATMNMMYSDYYNTAMKFGVCTPEFFGELAKEFLFDMDGPAPKEKLAAYYRGIVGR